MKLAVLAPIVWRTPPRKYGPWEQVASNIAEGMVQRGIDVTLFATANASTKGTLKYIAHEPYGEAPEMDPKVWECLHISNLMEQAHQYDLIHNHFDFLPLTYSKLIKTPMVTTIHGFSSPKILPVFQHYDNHTHYVSISDSDRSPLLNYMATVYNGIDTKEFTFCKQPDDYLLYFGRIHPEKGTYESIQIARQARKKLIISGFIQDAAYFEEKIQPYINDDDVVYVGNSGPIERDKLLGGASALLHPILFNEPFGLSVAEAMLCGTPVIAFKRGSMPELIEDSKTGFLVSSIGEAVSAVARLPEIDRTYCHWYASEKFSRDKMIEGYLEVYRRIFESL